MIHFSHCPVCKQSTISSAFSAKDHTVTGKQFPVWKCSNCTAMFTQDVPEQDAIGAYYVSEDYISHSETKAGLINKLYHVVRKRTLLSKLHLVRNESGKQRGKILDIGCGTGAFLRTMQDAGWDVTGLEPDDSARNKAVSENKVNAMPSAELFNLAPGSFDVITMWHVLEHVHQLHEYVSQLRKLLSSGGKIFIAVPNYTSYDAASYGAFWAAYDVPRHLYHFSPESMKKLIKMHGMEVTGLKPMWYDSYYVSMLSEKCRNGKGNIIRACLRGFLSNLKAVTARDKCSSLIYIISKEK